MDYNEADYMGMTDEDKQIIAQEQQMQQKSEENNPFEMSQYQHANAQDQPIVAGGGMVETLINDAEVPKHLRNKYWWIFNKDNVLTFLDNEKKNMKMVSFDVAVIDNMNSMDSYDDYTFAQEAQFNIMRNALDVKLDRAVGIKGGVKNERIILQSQFSESRAINEIEQGGDIKSGFFKRLLGRR